MQTGVISNSSVDVIFAVLVLIRNGLSSAAEKFPITPQMYCHVALSRWVYLKLLSLI